MSTSVYQGTEKIGDIVAEFPGASNIFREYKIDFCCGGNRSLLAVIEKQKLNAEEVLEKLNQAYGDMKEQSKQADWRKEPSALLIDHIVNKHHGYLQREMPLLSEFTTKILRVHGAGHPELASLHRLFHQVKMELDQHLIREEQVLFPLIKEYEQNPSEDVKQRVVKELEELENEHEQAGDLVKEMRQVTAEYQLPPEACRTYTLTFQKLQEFESDLFEHIHLENNVLFPRFVTISE
ncbi:iron-sulfur cluster repair di-iron protein [Fodinisporobacter ferrooxydans]|uniref:Iron-sulfur cluster repair di-iron protein n=1 Tax=Fodinisporobacter ferrooxydans TaxID=2901836 RepID=A0ABY4CUS9_9BACL|nr:iron-sulfur cluster repair di-iron protein [Alicyclobacillaceae bacterium MYW30-H2]